MKFVYQEPRPFMAADIKPSKCRFEYGNPSGHTSLALSLYPVAYYIYLKSKPISTPSKFILGFVCITIMLVIIVGRVYNGVHTYG